MDDKGRIVAILEAVEALLAAGFEPRRSLAIAFGHDEEVGGAAGAREASRLLAGRGVRFAFVLDEGLAVTEGIVPGVAPAAALIGIAEKGSVNVEMIARGEGGHASIPPPRTAAGRLAEAVARVETHPFPVRLRGPTRALFQHLAPEMRGGHRVLFANLAVLSPLVARRLAAGSATAATVRTTTAVTRLESGVKENVLPVTARAVVNLRILPGETIAGTVERLRDLAGSDIEVRALPGAWEPSPVSDPEAATFLQVAAVVRGVYPDAVVAPGLVLGATDSRHFEPISAAVYRFSPLRVGPEDLARIHGIDERLAVVHLEEMIRFYASIVQAACG
jgi:carboxypeptidase PM20D1